MSTISETDYFFGFSEAECILSHIPGKPGVELRIPNLHIVYSFTSYLKGLPSDLYAKSLNTGNGVSLPIGYLANMSPKPTPKKILEMLIKKCEEYSVIQILCGMNPENELYGHSFYPASADYWNGWVYLKSLYNSSLLYHTNDIKVMAKDTPFEELSLPVEFNSDELDHSGVMIPLPKVVIRQEKMCLLRGSYEKVLTDLIDPYAGIIRY